MAKVLDEQDRKDMRHRIVHTAAEEFARIGFEQTKIEAIAERAGIGKGTIYLYFDSKQDLFKAMLQEIAREQLEELQAALAGKNKLEEVLDALLTTFLRLTTEQPESMAIFISALYGVNRQFKETAAVQRLPFLKLIENVLIEAAAYGQLELEVEPFALIILNTCQSLALTAGALGFDPAYVQQQQAQIIKIFTANFQKSE